MIELIAKRQENSKRYKLDSRREQLVVSIGAIHYKNDYATDKDWLDIDLTWEGNRITEAPYILTRDKKLYTITNKKTGEITTIEVLSNNPDFNLIPDFTQIKFQHMTTFTPFEAKFRITGRGRFVYRAYDDEGELVLDASLVSGILTEKLSFVKDKYTQEIRLVKGNIRIDPTWQVGASTDDATRRLTDSLWSTTDTRQSAGAINVSFYQVGGGMRFANITIAQDETILDGTHLSLHARDSTSGTICNTRISADDVDDAVTFSTFGDFDTRWAARTTARVDWDAIPAWTAGVDYDSPEIKTVIQEIVGRPGWAQGAMVLFWEDFEDRSDHNTDAQRRGYTQDSSAEFAPKLVITVLTAAYWSGRIGEARIYNRALTPLEIQHNYLATKWRYQ